jgi:hypothetical protein
MTQAAVLCYGLVYLQLQALELLKSKSSTAVTTLPDGLQVMQAH